MTKSTKQIFHTGGVGSQCWGCKSKDSVIIGYGYTPQNASDDYEDKKFIREFNAQAIDPKLVESLTADGFA